MKTEKLIKEIMTEIEKRAYKTYNAHLQKDMHIVELYEIEFILKAVLKGEINEEL